MPDGTIQEVQNAILGALNRAHNDGQRCLVIVRCRNNAAVDQARETLMRTRVPYNWSSLPVAELSPPDLVGYLVHAGGGQGPAFLAYGLPRTRLGDVLPEFVQLLQERADTYLEYPTLCVLLVTLDEIRGVAVPARRFWSSRTSVVAWPDVADYSQYLPARMGGMRRRASQVPERADMGSMTRELGSINETIALGSAPGMTSPYGSSATAAMVNDPSTAPWAGAPFSIHDTELPEYLRGVAPPAGRRWGRDLAPGDSEMAELLDQCRLLLDQHEIERARQGLAKCAKTFRQVGNAIAAAECYVLLGLAGEARADYQVSLDWFSHALDLYKQVEDAAGFSDGVAMMGRIHFLRGDIAAAERHFRQALETDEKVADQLRMASSYRRLGIIAEQRDDLGRASTLYEKASHLEEQNADRYAQSRTLNHMARVRRNQGDMEEAERMLNDSLAIKRELNDEFGLSAGFHELGNLRLMQKDFLGAEEAYHSALELEVRHKDLGGVAATQAQLGLVCRGKNDVESAIRSFVIATVVFQKLKSPHQRTVADALETATRMIDSYTVGQLRREGEAYVAELFGEAI